MVSRTRAGIHLPTTMSREPSPIRAARSRRISSRVLTRRAAVIVEATAVMLVATLDLSGTTAVASASLRWRSTYDGPASQADAATAITIAPSGGRVFVTGSSDASTGRSRLATVAYSATTGAMRWVARERTAGDGFVNDIVAAAGRVFVAGGGRGSMLTVAYDGTSGDRSWSSTYPVRGYGGATAVAVSSLGDVFVTGGVPMTTIAYGPDTGRRLWRASHPGFGTDVAVSPSGQRLYAVGTTQRKAVAIAYRASDGHELWHRSVRRFSFFGSSGTADTLAVAPDGGLIFVGGSWGRGRKFGILAIRASSGELAWTRHFSVPPDGSVVTDVGVAPTGRRVFATGTLGIDPAVGFVTAAYRAENGARAWVDRVPLRVGYPAALAVAPSGRHLFVTGRAAGKLDTVSYRAGSGHRRWVRRLKGDSGGADAVVNPTGTVVLTGWRGNGRSKEFLTLAYSR
jgi:outer membrane protein assembly factor BamB